MEIRSFFEYGLQESRLFLGCDPGLGFGISKNIVEWHDGQFHMKTVLQH
ncbi:MULTISPECIES: hypothetical protein [Nitrosopumilus]|uniref:Uncharacterized protein n=1 Tax=Nitrosopumilus piranensis TaxID=1582439 RepID=A0A0C5BRU8_9ARCH|nr:MULTISPECIES: hypothetical protein [Nitrosopumilus]AJM92468.1 hypothetical protein NPIRD3C_1256 [Nitrosopumilus piranensis]